MNPPTKSPPVMWAVLVSCLVWVCLFLPLVNTPFGSLNAVSALRMVYEMSGFHRGGFLGVVSDGIGQAPLVVFGVFYVFGAFAFVGIMALRGIAYNRVAISAGSVGVVVFVLVIWQIGSSMLQAQQPTFGRRSSTDLSDVVQFVGLGVWAWVVLCLIAVRCGRIGLCASSPALPLDASAPVEVSEAVPTVSEDSDKA